MRLIVSPAAEADIADAYSWYEDPPTGNAWENQALFDFEGRPLPAMDEYRP
jgi:arabinogalactan endo-1,4-beta-galactosidase